MQKLVIATRNKGKIVEIQHALADFDWEIIGLADTAISPDFDVEEPAMTMEGYAVIKAITYGDKTGLLTLSEDAGLEVDALNGRPGVFSARYAPGTDADRYNKLLGELTGVLSENRGAQFRAVIAIYDPISKKIRTCEGIYRGSIIDEPRGTEGFGFDPVFYNSELKKTNAEMSIAEKTLVSHRGKALKQAREILVQDFS